MLNRKAVWTTAIIALFVVGSLSTSEADPGNGLRDRVDELEVTTEALAMATEEAKEDIDLLAGVARANVLVNCDAGGVLQDTIEAALPNTTIQVEGTCEENISIGSSKRGLVIDGQGSATISAASGPVVSISGIGITLRGFDSINGGGRGIVVSNNASAMIRSNIVEGAATVGITVEGTSFARILGNIVRDHGGNGISVTEGSSVRIGSDCTLATFNAINDNGASGISIIHNSEATIRGALIQGNDTNGIFIADNSMADTASNTISLNGGDGIDVRRGSSLRMGRRDTPDSSCSEDPNDSIADNGGVGVDCQSLSTVDGELGTLGGMDGSARLRDTNADCPNCCFTSLD